MISFFKIKSRITNPNFWSSGHPLQYVIRECSNIEHTNGTGWPFCTSWQDIHGEEDLTLNNNAPPPEELMIDYDDVSPLWPRGRALAV